MIIVKETMKAEKKRIVFLATIATEYNGIRREKRSIHTEDE